LSYLTPVIFEQTGRGAESAKERKKWKLTEKTRCDEVAAEACIVFSADATPRPSISEGVRLEYEVCAAIPTPDLAHSVPDIVTGKQHQETRRNRDVYSAVDSRLLI